MNAFFRDLRYSARLLLKSPTFSIAVVLSVAIGVGANAAIFSLMNAVLLKPLPFKNSERLVTLWQQPFKPRVLFAPLSGPNYKDCKEQTHFFQTLSAFTERKEVTLASGERSERVGTREVSHDFLTTFEVNPLLGRWFAADESGGGERNAAIISESLWKRVFGARSDVIGKEITLDREKYAVIGVVPSIFEQLGRQPVDVLLPLQSNAAGITVRDVYLLNVIGKLKPGATLSEAQAEMDVISARIAEKYPNLKTALAMKAMTATGITILWYRGLLLMLQAATLFVLLIACTNVATLLLARWTGRQQEFGIRAALGATRWSLLRFSLCESILLVASGTLLGVWLGDALRRALLSVAPRNIPRIAEVQIDIRVLAGTIALSACLAIFFALVPLLFARRIEINDWLRQGGRAATSGIGRQRMRGFLVASQIVLTVVLLSGAGLVLRSLWRLQKTDLGFQPENLLTFHLYPDRVRYRITEDINTFYLTILDRIRATPGIADISLASDLPFTQGGTGNYVARPGQTQNPGERILAHSEIVTPEYYRTLGIKVVNGRALTSEDAHGAPAVTMINETLARHLFPSENPVGQQLEIAASQWPDPDTVQPRTAQIVGVVADIKQWGITVPPHDVFHVPFAQNPAPSMFVLARTQIHSATLVDSIRAIVSKVDPDLPVYDVQLMTDRIRSSDLERRFNATLLVFFAATALLATAIGIYGTVAFWVTQRTHEIGVRMALGANRRQVVSLIAGKIARLILAGVILGLPAALAVVRLIRSFVYGGQAPADLFYGVSSFDPVTMLAVLGALVGSAAIATTFPAWRATQIDPARALRAE